MGGWIWEVFTPLPTSWRSGASWVNGELVSFCSVGEEVTTVVTIVLWVSSILSIYFSKFIVTDWEGFLNSFDEVADVVNLVLAEGEDETGLGYDRLGRLFERFRQSSRCRQSYLYGR